MIILILRWCGLEEVKIPIKDLWILWTKHISSIIARQVPALVHSGPSPFQNEVLLYCLTGQLD